MDEPVMTAEDLRTQMWARARRGHYRDRDDEFMKDAARAFGLDDGLRSAKAMALAWEWGHADGHVQVLDYVCDLADLLDPQLPF